MKILTLTILLAAVATLSSCNTVAGIGTDIQKGGRALNRAAR